MWPPWRTAERCSPPLMAAVIGPLSPCDPEMVSAVEDESLCAVLPSGLMLMSSRKKKLFFFFKFQITKSSYLSSKIYNRDKGGFFMKACYLFWSFLSHFPQFDSSWWLSRSWTRNPRLHHRSFIPVVFKVGSQKIRGKIKRKKPSNFFRCLNFFVLLFLLFCTEENV